jgi:hypothetical protein
MAPTVLTVPIEEAITGSQQANCELVNAYLYTFHSLASAIEIQLWVITRCSIKSTTIGIPMETSRITQNYRCATLAIVQLLVFSCLLTCGCGSKTTLTQKVSSADYDAQKERIERIVGVKLPESAGNCRYDSKSYGFGSGVGWGYFEISRSDLPYLLDASDNLPNASELGQNPVATENIERAMQQTGVSLTWWKPFTLKRRQYANKVIGSMGFVGGPQMDICVGEIHNNLMGVYLVYHSD